MKRIDSEGALDHLFTEGDPIQGKPPTVVSADWLNHVQEEIARFIESRGIVLDGSRQDQLTQAILDAIEAELVPTENQLNAHIQDQSIHYPQSDIDHHNIQNRGSNSHAQIDSHLADGNVHYPQTSIDHNNLQNRGVYAHSQIDSHINDGNIHYPPSSIDHGNLGGLEDDDHPLYPNIYENEDIEGEWTFPGYDPPLPNAANKYGFVKGWLTARWDTAAYQPDDSYNVSSLTTTANSQFTVNWDVQYDWFVHPVVAGCESSGVTAHAQHSTSARTVNIKLSATPGGGAYVFVVACGNQQWDS
ncbi:MAG: hypothetical protein HY538_07530 [Deltaproteobacteria bacterium]|nr:hypothetical protein [Deltaproteobacteria bacterium]